MCGLDRCWAGLPQRGSATGSGKARKKQEAPGPRARQSRCVVLQGRPLLYIGLLLLLWSAPERRSASAAVRSRSTVALLCSAPHSPACEGTRAVGFRIKGNRKKSVDGWRLAWCSRKAVRSGEGGWHGAQSAELERKNAARPGGLDMARSGARCMEPSAAGRAGPPAGRWLVPPAELEL